MIELWCSVVFVGTVAGGCDAPRCRQRESPFPFRPIHAWLVWCWLACVWSVYGHVVAAAAALLVHGCLSRLMVGLFGVDCLAPQRALARSDVVRVVVMPVSVFVGNVPFALGRHGTF